MMKARIAIVSISSLISLAMVVSVIGCLELGSSPKPVPTIAPTPEPTDTPTLAPTPYLGGPRPVYDVETKAWMTVTPTATPFPPTPTRIRARVVVTATPVPPTKTPTVTPTPTPTSIPTPTWDMVWDRERMESTAYTLSGEFEPLTLENYDKAIEAYHSGILDERRLSDGDKRSLSKGLREYDLPSFVHRCLTDELEYPALTQELEKQWEFYGWERLDFIRDGSSSNFLYYVDSFTVTPHPFLYKIQSLYRTGDDEGVVAQIGVHRDTCEPNLEGRRRIRFAFGERIINRTGGRNYKGNRDYLNIYIKFTRAYIPLTNEEIETGIFKCRDKKIGMPLELADHCKSE